MESTYVSAFQIFNNIYDMKIDFSTVEPVTNDNGEVTGNLRAMKSRIAMSPALAKELACVLGQVVSDYEKQFGVIPEIKLNGEE